MPTEPNSAVQPKIVSKRQRIISEILSTEDTYVSFLRVLGDSYVTRLQMRLLKTPIITQKEIQMVFQNSVKLLKISEHLYDSLYSRCTSPDFSDEEGCISDIFLQTITNKKFRFQEEYQEFINNYQIGVQTINDLSKQNVKFQKFSLDVLRRSKEKFASIHSYLISPVQRLPRYILLLRDLHKSTPDGHPDKEGLHQVAEAIRDITLQINEGKKYYEDMLRKESLFRRFTRKCQKTLQEEVHPEDIIIAEAPLLVEGKGEHIGFVLTSKIIIASNTKSSTQLILCNIFSNSSLDWEFVERSNGSKHILFISLDRIEVFPFFQKNTYRFTPINDRRRGWNYWTTSLQEVKKHRGPLALTSRALDVKKHLQKFLLTTEHWAILSLCGKDQTHLPIKSVLVAETELMNHVIFLKSGILDITKGMNGSEVTLASCYPGDIVGDITFLTALKTRAVKPATASIITADDKVSITKVSHDILLECLQGNPDLHWRFYYFLSVLITERIFRIDAINAANAIKLKQKEEDTNPLNKKFATSSVVDNNRQLSARKKSVSSSALPNERKRRKAPESKKKSSLAHTKTQNIEVSNVLPLVNSVTKKKNMPLKMIHKKIAEPILEWFPCKYTTNSCTDQKGREGRLLFSEKYIALRRSVFGKKTTILLPAAMVLSLKKDDTKQSITINMIPFKNTPPPVASSSSLPSLIRAKSNASKKYGNVSRLGVDSADIYWTVQFRSLDDFLTAHKLLHGIEVGNANASVNWDAIPEDSFDINEIDLFGEPAVYRKDTVVVAGGLLGHSVFQITSGRCAVAIPTSDGGQTIVAHLEEGAIFGELSFLLGTISSASVIVSSPEASIMSCSSLELAEITKKDEDTAAGFFKFIAQSICNRFLAAEKKLFQ